MLPPPKRPGLPTTPPQTGTLTADCLIDSSRNPTRGPCIPCRPAGWLPMLNSIKTNCRARLWAGSGGSALSASLFAASSSGWEPVARYCSMCCSSSNTHGTRVGEGGVHVGTASRHKRRGAMLAARAATDHRWTHGRKCSHGGSHPASAVAAQAAQTPCACDSTAQRLRLAGPRPYRPIHHVDLAVIDLPSCAPWSCTLPCPCRS